jgi:hypothetical protein
VFHLPISFIRRGHELKVTDLFREEPSRGEVHSTAGREKRRLLPPIAAVAPTKSVPDLIDEVDLPLKRVTDLIDEVDRPLKGVADLIDEVDRPL